MKKRKKRYKQKPMQFGNHKNWGSIDSVVIEEHPLPYSPVIEMKDMPKKRVKEIVERLLARDKAERERLIIEY